MEDERIIDLFFERSERAISECQKKYSAYCSSIAANILGNHEDTEECVSDTWLRAWNAIPPARPSRLSIYLGKITRHLAIDRYRKGAREKHGGSQMALCLEELSECVGADAFIEEKVIVKDLMESFLRSLEKEDRDIFLFRYWYLMPNEQIASRFSLSESAVKMRLVRMRKKLKEYLEKNT